MVLNCILRKVHVLFTRQCGIHAEPDITLNGEPIPVKREQKFLGFILDEKLTYIPHIKVHKQKCLNTMNILFIFIYFILRTIEGPCRVGNYIIFKASNTMEDVANVATNVTSNEI